MRKLRPERLADIGPLNATVRRRFDASRQEARSWRACSEEERIRGNAATGLLPPVAPVGTPESILGGWGRENAA